MMSDFVSIQLGDNDNEWNGTELEGGTTTSTFLPYNHGASDPLVHQTVKTAKVTSRHSRPLTLLFSYPCITRIAARCENAPLFPCTYNTHVHASVGRRFYILTRLIYWPERICTWYACCMFYPTQTSAFCMLQAYSVENYIATFVKKIVNY